MILKVRVTVYVCVSSGCLGVGVFFHVSCVFFFDFFVNKILFFKRLKKILFLKKKLEKFQK